MAEIHKSRKLKRLHQAHRRAPRADADLARAKRRFLTWLPKGYCGGSFQEPSEHAARRGCLCQVDSDGWLDIKSDDKELLSLRAEGAYALYQLLERAFGKD